MLHARRWKKRTSDVLRIWFTIARCQKLKKADSDDLRIIFIQTITKCQKVKKRTSNVLIIWFTMARCQNLKKADTRHFVNNFYSDNCYMPETEKKRTPMISDDLRIIFIQTIATCQKVKKADSDILRIWSTIAICQKVTKVDSDILTILEWSPMLQGNFNYIHSVFLYFIDSTYVILY